MKRVLAIVLGIGMSISCGSGSTSMSGPMISVSISPLSALVAFGAAQQFTATVTGTSNTAVIWSVAGEGCTVDTCGTIDANGLYLAPLSAAGHSSVRVVATLVADSTKLGAASVSLGSSGGTPIPGPKITTTSMPDGSIGVAYNAEVATQQGIPPFGWDITAGALPPGLELTAIANSYNKIGIAGTPTTTGSYDFTIRVRDDRSPPLSDSKDLRIVVN